MGIVIKAINEHGTGRFLIHYEKPASPCECRMIRQTAVMLRKTKPTDKEAIKYIENLKK